MRENKFLENIVLLWIGQKPFVGCTLEMNVKEEIIVISFMSSRTQEVCCDLALDLFDSHVPQASTLMIQLALASKRDQNSEGQSSASLL